MSVQGTHVNTAVVGVIGKPRIDEMPAVRQKRYESVGALLPGRVDLQDQRSGTTLRPATPHSRSIAEAAEDQGAFGVPGSRSDPTLDLAHVLHRTANKIDLLQAVS